MNLGEIDEFLEGQRKTTESQATTTTKDTWVVTSLFKKMNLCFTGGSEGKESAFNVGDPGSNPGSGRCPGEGNGNPLQYSCLEKSMDRGYGPWDGKESDTTEQLTLFTFWFR